MARGSRRRCCRFVRLIAPFVANADDFFAEVRKTTKHQMSEMVERVDDLLEWLVDAVIDV